MPFIAPIKCSILPISANERLEPIIAAVQNNLTKLGITSKIVRISILFLKYTCSLQDDSSGSIGRRYARTDEVTKFKILIFVRNFYEHNLQLSFMR